MIASVLLITMLIEDIAKLNHAATVAAIHQWRCCLFSCFKSTAQIVNTVFDLSWH